MKFFWPTVLLLTANIALAGDPTRPPEIFLVQTPASANEPTSASRLQFIKLDKTTARTRKQASTAMIDGQIYKLGDMVGDTKLVRIRAESVVLSGPSGKEELFLTPDIALQPRKPGGTRK